MSIEYHPAVEQDVAEALQRYDAVSQKLGDEFKAELRRMISVAARNPRDSIKLSPACTAQIFFVSHIILFIARFPTAFESHWCDTIAAIPNSA